MLLAVVLIVTCIVSTAALYVHYWLLNRALARLAQSLAATAASQHDQVNAQLAAIFVDVDASGNTQFNAIAESLITALAQRLTQSLAATVMGQARQAAQAADTMISDVISKANPGMSALIDIVPGVLGKALRKRPEALAQIQAAMAKAGTGGGNGTHQVTTGKSGFGFNS
jgi:hypothetical protein